MAPSALAFARYTTAVPRSRASRPGRRVSRGAFVVPTAARSEFAAFFPDEVTALEEPAAVEMARQTKQISVDVPGRARPVMTSCVGSPAPTGGEQNAPFVLLHGFDSSHLEYRRLFPMLAEKAETWAVDLLGWGFTDAGDAGIGDYSPEAKRVHLYAFWKQEINRPITLCGASLGGAAAIDFATAHPECVEKLVLVDAQGFIEGLGPMGLMPRPVALAGVNILKTKILRNTANQMAYSDKQKFATEDAMRVGQLHTFAPQWADATLSFMKSDGYKVASRVRTITQETLILWGREDSILDTKYAARFDSEVPKSKLQWVEKCGHVAHLEQPAVMRDALFEFAGVAK
tara:strand:- start:3834 stop:4868 length:1035 start_codon:yes stop_codon:yes gene_type:complete